MNNRLINTKVAGGGGGCTDIVDNYDPFGGNGVALYQLNGDATDESGNYNGTASNVTYGTGVFGQSGVFNGSNSRITTVASQLPIPASGAFTVSFWAKVDSSLTQYNTCMLSFGDFWLKSEYPTGEFGLGDINAGYQTTSSMGYGWNHCVLTVDASNNINLYLNGANEFTGNKSISRTNGGNFAIGVARLSNPVYYFNGQLDQVRIFDTALTPLEVEALYTEELCICDGTVDTLDILGYGSCIATYPLDGNTNDLSGNYSGTPTDVSYGIGEFDLAGVFNGSSSKIRTSINVDNISHSYSCWIKTTQTSDGWIISNRSVSGATKYTGFYNNSGNIELDIGGSTNVSGSGVATNGNWQHCVMTFDNSASPKVGKLYVDKVLVQEKTTTTTVNSGYNVDIGILVNAVSLFNGSIDQVRIFNKALSAGEVTTLYNETACTTDSPKIAYVNSGVSNQLTSVLSYNKGQLNELDSITTGSGGGVAIDKENNIAYACYDGGVKSIDISNPSNLIELDNLVTSNLAGGWGIKLDLDNEVAYAVGISSSYIVSIDISNPSSMTVLDSYTSSNTAGAIDLALDLTNNVAYIAAITGDKVVSIDISNPSSMSELNAITHSSLDNVRAIELDLTNQIAYTASYLSNTITAINISNPSSMSVISSLSGLQQAIGIALDLENNVAYVSEYTGNKVTSIDISNPSSMSELDSLGGTGMTRARGLSIDVNEKILYVASTDSDAINSVDISNPSNLVLIDTITNSNFDGASNVALAF
jgi:6-phosphogluconolactonase (cycloisomerase 2 family)